MKVYEVLLKFYSVESKKKKKLDLDIFSLSFQNIIQAKAQEKKALHLLVPDVISLHDGMNAVRWGRQGWTADYW